MRKLLIIPFIFLLFYSSTEATSSNEIILFDKCYSTPEFNNYEAYKSSQKNGGNEFYFDEWNIKIDLRKNKITLTTKYSDDAVAAFKKKLNQDVQQFEVQNFSILSSTSGIVVVNLTMGFSHILNTKTGKLEIFRHNKDGKKNHLDTMQCKVS